jgi:hypothetical protein
MKEVFKIDISIHKPQNLSDVQLNCFEYIIVLDNYVREKLKEEYSINSQKVMFWDIQDPYLQGLETYKKCADKILSYIQAFYFANLHLYLQKKVSKWQEEIKNGQIDRGTLMQGIANKSSSLFEDLFRELLGWYLLFTNIDYEKSLRKTAMMKNKTFNKLTMGDILQLFINQNLKITEYFHSHTMFNKRKILDPALERNLTDIKDFRNLLEHHPDEFAPDLEILQENISNMLLYISYVLCDPFCIIPNLFCNSK